MRAEVWLRTGSNPVNINRFQSHTVKKYEITSPFLAIHFSKVSKATLLPEAKREDSWTAEISPSQSNIILHTKHSFFNLINFFMEKL